MPDVAEAWLRRQQPSSRRVHVPTLLIVTDVLRLTASLRAISEVGHQLEGGIADVLLNDEVAEIADPRAWRRRPTMNTTITTSTSVNPRWRSPRMRSE